MYVCLNPPHPPHPPGRLGSQSISLTQFSETNSDIIKMDIEFAEFPSLKSLSEAFPISEGYEFPVGQILVELHLWQREGITTKEFLDWWEMLEDRGLRPAWTEPNVLHVALKREDGHARLAEYTLINTRDKRSVLL